MIPFDVLFGMDSEVEYKGKVINKFFRFSNKGQYTLTFTFIKTNSHFNQAIVIFLNEFDGEFILDGDQMKIPKNRFPKFNFWADTAPAKIEIEVIVEQGSLTICNGSDPIGTKQICHSLSFGCAMIIDKIDDNTYRFYCNDHENDDDFDDLVFEMEICKK